MWQVSQRSPKCACTLECGPDTQIWSALANNDLLPSSRGFPPLGFVIYAVSGAKIPMAMMVINKSQDHPRALRPIELNFVFERSFSAVNSSPRGREYSSVKTTSYPSSLSRISTSYGPK